MRRQYYNIRVHHNERILGRTTLLFTHVHATLPVPEVAYLEEVVNRVQNSFGSRLVGVYLFGSAGSGEYEPGISDLDVQAVIREPVSLLQREELAGHLAHVALPCPASRLDFVCYTHSSIDPANRYPSFELNFNTGGGILEQFMLAPKVGASHWFLLDIALGRELGHALLGPPPATIFAPIPRVWLLQAMCDSLAWHQLYDSGTANTVLNACREWRYALTGMLGSKAAGAAWAGSQPECPPIVRRAVQSRRDGTLLNPSEVSELIAIASEAVRQALQIAQ